MARARGSFRAPARRAFAVLCLAVVHSRSHEIDNLAAKVDEKNAEDLVQDGGH